MQIYLLYLTLVLNIRGSLFQCTTLSSKLNVNLCIRKPVTLVIPCEVIMKKQLLRLVSPSKIKRVVGFNVDAYAMLQQVQLSEDAVILKNLIQFSCNQLLTSRLITKGQIPSQSSQ